MNRSDNLTIILNPAAGGGSGRGIAGPLRAVLSERGVPHSFFLSGAPGHAESLAREAAQAGSDLVVAVGGDGTVHEVANGLLKDGPGSIPLAMIPVGTGNDFQRMLGGSRRLEDAVDGVLLGSVRRFDVGRVRSSLGTAYFVNLLGVGLDVAALKQRNRFPRLRGLPQYLAALFSAFWTFHPPQLRVTIGNQAGAPDGEVVEGRTLLAAVTVGPSVGGGFLLNPGASPEDGILDFIFVEPLGILKLARYVPKVLRGRHPGLPEVLQRRIRSLELEGAGGEPLFFEMDGEVVTDPVLALEIDVCPGALPVVVPGDLR